MSSLSNSEIFNSGVAQASDYLSSGGNRIIGDKVRMSIIADQAPTPNFNSTSIYRINNNQGNKMLTKPVLTTYVGPISKTSGTPTTLALVDWFGIFCFDKIELMYNGKLLSQVTASQMYNNFIAHNSTDELAILKKQLGGGYTDAERTTLALGDQAFYLDLSQVFSLLSDPLELLLLTSPLEVRVTYAQGPATRYIRSVGTVVGPTFTYNKAAELIVCYTDIKNELTSILKSGPINKFYYDSISVPLSITNTATQQSFPLSQLNNNDVILITTNTRLQSDLNHVTLPTYTNNQLIPSYTLKSQGQYISGANFDYTDDYIKKVYIENVGFTGERELSQSNIYPISYASDIDSTFGEHNVGYTGSKSFTGITDAQLSLMYTSAPAAQDVMVNVTVAKRLILDKGQIYLMGN